LVSLTIATFEISHVLGVNTSDPHTARLIFMWNISNVLTTCFFCHWMYALLGMIKERRISLYSMYSLAALILVFLLSRPDYFMLDPVPKMYFHNYYMIGKYYFLTDLLFYFFIGKAFYHMIRVYISADKILKNRIRYVLLGALFSFVSGSMASFLIYGINVDPIYSMFIGFYAIPLAYSILKYDLMDIKVAAKRAFLYTVGIVALSFIIIAINSVNDFLAIAIPGFPLWIIPLLSGCVSVGIGAFVWRKIREVDTLKYEFITVVTHKFRTPLTYIKWSTDSLINASTSEGEKKHAIEKIQGATNRLVELTSTLVGLARTDNDEYLYHYSDENLENVIKDIMSTQMSHILGKNLTVEYAIDSSIPTIAVDEKRMRFALQILAENAVMYTPTNGRIYISLGCSNKEILFSIKDSGIGIPKNELPYIFSKFFRGINAKHVDTEGIGVGLYMAKHIIEKHGGELTVDSEGEGKGTRFTIRIKVRKSNGPSRTSLN